MPVPEKSPGLAEAAILAASAALLFIFTGCQSAPEVQARVVGRAAAARLAESGGPGHLGRLTLTQEADHTRVELEVRGLSPGLHGVHIHQGRSCAQPGPHFSPGLHPHGAPLQGGGHFGDLGNVMVGPDGTGRLVLNSPYLSLQGPDGVLGRAVVVHAYPDDQHSQPDGLSGPPLACGLIALQRP